MNKLIAIIFVTSCLSSHVFAQKEIYYYDKYWRPSTKKSDYAYTRTVEPAGDRIYVITDYYDDGTRQMTGTYVTKYPGFLGDDRSSLYRHDTFTWYNPHGIINCKGKFIHGYRHGEWLYYYDDGLTISERCYFDNGKKTGTWREYNTDGKVVRSKQYDSVLHGKAEYYVDGKLHRTEIYKRGELIETIPPAIENTGDSDKKFAKPGYDMNKFLTKKIKYPKEARKLKIGGKALIIFTVNTEGYIIDIEPASPGVHELLMLEAIRVVSIMPKWQPGTLKGKPVNVYYTLPINFKPE